MTVIMNLTYNNINVRTVEIDNATWWIAKDVCEIIGIEQVSRAMERLDDDEYGLLKVPHPRNADKLIEVNAVNESGLYQLIIASNKPEAKAFKRWVTHDVLPSIRRHGMYATPETIDVLSNDPDALQKILNALKDEQTKRADAERETARLQLQMEADQPKVIFADAVAASRSTITIFELAKLLKQNGVAIDGQRLFVWLRENGYLCKHGRQWNTPTARAINAGWLEIKWVMIMCNGKVTPRKTPVVTGKGQAYFVTQFLQRHGKKPQNGNPSIVLLQRRPKTTNQQTEPTPCKQTVLF